MNNNINIESYLRTFSDLGFTYKGVTNIAKRFDVPMDFIFDEITKIKKERAVPVPVIPKKKKPKKPIKRPYIEYDEAFILSTERNGLRALNQMKLAEKRRVTGLESLKIPAFTDGNTNDLTKCIIEFIRLSGGQAERINTTGRMLDNRTRSFDEFGNIRVIGKTQWIKSSGSLGSADISATIKGLSVKIEVKFGKDFVSKAQDLYKDEIEKAGGIYLIAKTFQGFYEWFKAKFWE